MIDKNLELIVSSSEAYLHVEAGTKQLELDSIKRKSRDMINSLRDKTKIPERDQRLQHLKGMRAGNWSQKLFGANVEYLVLKYISTVKSRVFAREDKALQDMTEKLVTSIIKK